ncbi:DUF3037 domain-containing protein [Flavobacterium humi]|uniref:DUF3037 domain-containing protein n=1 Tax=Flavobacterium humi TaxID=2562683 RepID=A0A4Z0L803_9FLAO|nr:DUF3037 domain-containing protein [Flavobacterium humi]TGD57720.1 DUF3037 domain-containing protein [Flavobacterium humi]
MPEKHLYEYAVIRVVPRVEREEFINVGLLLFCKRQKYLRMAFQVPAAKIRLLCPEFDIDQLETNLMSFTRISAGEPNSGPIAAFETAERFRWLTAVRSSSIQTSRPHPGFSTDLDQTFEKLYAELVL